MKYILRYFLIYLLGLLSGLVFVTLYVSAIQRSANISYDDLPVDQYQPDISITSENDIFEIREKLIEYLFNRKDLENVSPPRVENGTMRVDMQNGIVSKIELISPKGEHETLIIYHTGHEGLTKVEAEFIDKLVQAGYPVWRIDMPFVGDNNQTIRVSIPKVGTISISNHDQMIYLSPVTDGSPIRYFIEPVVAAINEAINLGYKRIIMIGLSGGGWTTTLAAAIDPRIDASYSVAGTIPIGLRFDHSKNWGDWEQTFPDLYQIASYEDLYIMASNSRKHIQVLNEFDPCCFDDPRYYVYEAAVHQTMEKIEGIFEVWWNEDEKQHHINPITEQMILNDLSKFP
jgi:pimeloyl-ACP methyl ester carboxylesterase